MVSNDPLLTDSALAAAQRADVITFEPTMANLGPAVCCIGAFDGLHRGHRFIIDQMVAQARSLGLPTVVVTFLPDPDELFKPIERLQKLASNPDRIAQLATTSADHVLVIPFDRALSALSPLDFLQQTLSLAMHPVAIHVGSDFRFGRRTSGTVADLVTWGEGHICQVFAHELLCETGQAVTSTRIRGYIREGRVEEAADLLTRPFHMRADVVYGRCKGAAFGFPTANLVPSCPYVTVGDGVYGGYVAVGEKVYKAAVSVGVPATFEGVESTIEAHILGFEGDIYGQSVKVSFAARLRGMQAFATVEELKSAVNANIDWVANNL